LSGWDNLALLALDETKKMVDEMFAAETTYVQGYKY